MPEQAKTVLIVVDVAEEQTAIAQAMAAKGYQTRVTGSGNEALEMVKQAAPTLVILKTKLPDIGGFVVCRRLRALEGCDPKIKIIMLTDQVTGLESRKVLEYKANDYVYKTPDYDRLLNVVDEQMNVSGFY